ncbi:TMV resistance protein N-like [Corylus avellana]|uniref:TMV resistance protein N-like n=1 Tax=Corylus avellana TaxID=13451 RepID=UPI00286A4A5F|nr:TMV resistance protein N-like [Corylus avellana]
MAFHGVASSSSSSSSDRQWDYDVFLSFRGKDTRNNFTAHLYAALDRNGINTYKDDVNLKRGENISPELLNAIEKSRISVIVLSQNYASSSWCLDELAKICDCKEMKGQIVVPVFYKVHPSEVRYQKKNTFGEAFAKHEERFKDDRMNVQRWKTALTEVASLSGWHSENRNEPELIQEIIEWVNSILVKETCFQVAPYPVGIESCVQAVKSLLDMENKESIHMVGIFGIGGIGKTTLAKAIYKSIASEFDNRCFLSDIRETCSQTGGLISLQNKLLSRILGRSSLTIDNVDEGIGLIGQRLRLKRVLLVLDDVDQSVQLKKLAGKVNWFGLGSRIIITTRDENLLTKHQVLTYEVKELDCNEALQLFSYHAFDRDRPNDGYVEVTKDAVRYAGGLPLALVVLGSTLKGRDIPYWESKLDEYKRIPHSDIQNKLRISFDGLDENAQSIFLDIACFFKGENVEYVKKMLDSFGFISYSGIKELKEKCLITESSPGSLVMHDLLQEMGREIVRQESPRDPGKRSRLWFHEDVRCVLEGDMGTNKVEGILIDLPGPDLIIQLSPKTFKKMKMLRLFINRNAHFSEEPNIYSNELRVIDWAEYPGESFPSNFRGKNLVILRMAHSRIKILEGVQHFQNLTTMDFYDCKFLETIPDVSRIPNLESLKLVDCEYLVEVHCSVGFLDQLVELIITSCSNLRSFPKILKLRSLKYLEFFGCSMLKNFPEIDCRMECLEDIYFHDTGIEELPSSIRYLVGLKKLHLDNSKNLMNLPDSIHQLQHLESLGLNGCTGIKELPSSFGYMGKIERLLLNNCTNLTNLPDSIYQSQNLVYLSLNNCSKVRFVEKVEDNRQSIPSVVSLEESAISSGTELLQLLPSKNSSGSILMILLQ